VFTPAYLDVLRELATRAGLAPADARAPDREWSAAGIWLDEWGAGNGPTVLFLHGSGQTARVWDLLCGHLASRYHCVALDLPGHGRSDWADPDSYAIGRTALQLAPLITGPTTVVGLSRGGLIGLRLAAIEPRVEALAVLDIAPSVLTRREKGGEDLGTLLRTPVVRPTVEDFVALSHARNPRRDLGLLRTTIRHSVRQLPDGNWTWHWDPAMFAGDRADISGDLENDARAIGGPLLVVRGEHSPMLDPGEAARFAALPADGEYVTVPAAGHSIPGDNPAGLLAVLEPWLDRVTGSWR